LESYKFNRLFNSGLLSIMVGTAARMFSPYIGASKGMTALAIGGGGVCMRVWDIYRV
jgi:hypothetical protein